MRAGLLLFLCVAAWGGNPLKDETALRRRGIKALPELLALVEAEDPDARLRARRLAKVIVLDHYRALAPDGMHLVPGAIELRRTGARMVGGLYLDTREVTTGEFLRYARQARIDTGRWKRTDPELPVVRVTLEEARGYAKWRGGRLPTSEELVRAASAGGRVLYPWGDGFEPRRVVSRESGLGGPLPPGSRSLGRSADGIDDLVGNVAEWTDSPAEEARGTRFRVVGGSYLRYAKGIISGDRFVTYRLRITEWRSDVGFRLARSLPPFPSMKTMRKAK